MKKIFFTLTTIIFICLTLPAQHRSTITVFFEHGKSEITADAEKKLKAAISALKYRISYQLLVTGYTDDEGSDGYNKLLSKQRAEAVIDFVCAKGVEKNKLQKGYYGERKPIASNATDEGKQQNRRVDISVIHQDLVVPKAFLIEHKVFKVHPDRDTALALDSKGTTLHIPKDCFTDPEGKPVKDPVDLRYREFSNPAEIAFSGIPMTYVSNQEKFCFNSSGMFELSGVVKKKPVQISKGKKLKVDYALVKKNSDIAFFRLNDNGNHWQKVQNIQKMNNKAPREASQEKVEFDFVFNVADGKTVELSTQVMALLAKRNREKNTFVEPKNVNRTSGSLLGDGLSCDPGHSYPDIVKGLNVESFGVYNCDQIYRLSNRIDVTASYVNEEGKEIAEPYVLSLIDLNYNGAFSFNPANFICDANGKNVLALFTKSGLLYLLDQTGFANMNINESGSYTFKMKDVSKEIKNSKDLAGYLGIKI